MSRVGRTFPQQSSLGRRVIGVEAPTVVLPLPTLRVQTLSVTTTSVRARMDLRRRGAHSRLRYTAGVPGIFDTPFGQASPSGSIVEAATHAPLPFGQAAPSGFVVDTFASGSSIPVARVVMAGHRRGHWILAPPTLIGRNTGNQDIVSGSSSASGSISESFVAQASLSGAATPTGSLTESFSPGGGVPHLVVTFRAGRFTGHAALRAPTVVASTPRSFSDVVSGSASATGTTAEAQTHSSSPFGQSSATGTAGDSFSVFPVLPVPLVVQQVVAITSARVDRLVRRVASMLFAPAIVSVPTLPTLDQRTVDVKLSGRTRLDERRRRGRVRLAPPRVVAAAIYIDAVTGTAAPATGSVVQSLTHASSVSGAASPSGTAADQKVYAAVVTGSASASGSTTDAKAVADSPTGTSSATGFSSDAFHVGNVFSDNPSGAATASGTVVNALTIANTCTGTATASGVIVERRLYPDTMSGAATPSGTIFFEQHVWNDTPTGVAVTPTGVMTFESLTVSVFAFGSASATGSVREKVSRGSGQPVHFKTSGWRSRWTVKLRV